MQRVVVDANVFVSLLTGRHQKQHEAARALLRGFEQVDLAHVPRGKNADADRLVNAALDAEAAAGR